MAKTRKQKEDAVVSLEKRLKEAHVVLFSSFGQHAKKGLEVQSIQDLKKQLRENDASFVVVKKKLMRKALEKCDLVGGDEVKDIEGTLGVVFGDGDMVAPARDAYAVSKINKEYELNFGLMMEEGKEARILSGEEVIQLAKLPSKEVLLGQLMGAMKAPIFMLRNVFEGNLRNLVLILGNIKGK